MKIKHKFLAKPQKIDDKHFSSKLEARYYQKLKDAQAAGELLFFLRQVGFDLPGKSKYVVDFVEFWPDEVIFTDCKGLETQTFKLKQRQIEEIYPIKINIVKKV